jgi:hypothetical protein
MLTPSQFLFRAAIAVTIPQECQDGRSRSETRSVLNGHNCPLPTNLSHCQHV